MAGLLSIRLLLGVISISPSSWWIEVQMLVLKIERGTPL